MLTVVDIQTIVHLYRSGDYSRRGIARKLGISRTTVDKVLYILTEKWAGLSFKNGPPERAYKVNKIMRRCHCSDLVFNHLLSLFEPV